jgi:adenylate kinase family enzyme
MKRVLVIGSGGSGKSTFSVMLAAKTGLPLVHLDRLYWKPGWIEPAKADWEVTVRRLIAEPRWILDGNYGGTLPERLAACDTVVFLDAPRLVCVTRVLLRRLRHALGTRPDVAEGCPEQLTWSFLAWIWGYPSRRRGEILRRLGGLEPNQRAVILRSPSQTKRFLDSLGDGSSTGIDFA